jgi:poly(A) RNA polymerase GLD2
MGAINSVRRLTIESIGLLEAMEPNPVEIAAKKQVNLSIERLIQKSWPHIKLIPFGSSEKYVT